MSLATVASIHGILAWTTVVLLAVAVAVVHRAPRFAYVVVALTSATFSLGLALYPAYSRLLRPAIYLASRAHGVAFERKEHLAVGVVAFAWVGALAATSNDKTLARVAFFFAATLALVVAILGTYVARMRGF